MAAQVVTAESETGSVTLSGTASTATQFRIHTIGTFDIYSTSALELDRVSADAATNGAVVGWPVPASQGYTIHIAKIPSAGYAIVTIWSATASAVVIWHKHGPAR